ncbi:MAG: hypothetical protein IKE43_02920 [Coriobacteriales bacterium]|nr:hypothetical protein [Coriobacteriales bacterium]
MGRMIGWIGPVLYILMVAGMGIYSYFMLSSGVAAHTALAFYGIPIVLPLSAPTTLLIMAGFWSLAMLWFFVQVGITHEDKLEDELWCNHMLNVAFVSRLFLIPFMVTLFVYAVLTLLGFTAMGGTSVFWALLCELIAVVATIPAACYQISSVNRLAKRDSTFKNTRAFHIVLAFLPILGFVAMSGIYTNGKEVLINSHDERIIRENAQPSAASCVAETPAPQAQVVSGAQAPYDQADENACFAPPNYGVSQQRQPSSYAPQTGYSVPNQPRYLRDVPTEVQPVVRPGAQSPVQPMAGSYETSTQQGYSDPRFNARL